MLIARVFTICCPEQYFSRQVLLHNRQENSLCMIIPHCADNLTSFLSWARESHSSIRPLLSTLFKFPVPCLSSLYCAVAKSLAPTTSFQTQNPGGLGSQFNLPPMYGPWCCFSLGLERSFYLFFSFSFFKRKKESKPIPRLGTQPNPNIRWLPYL